MANDRIVIDPPEQGPGSEPTKKRPSAELASWVMGHVNPWRQIRDGAYQARWDEYYAIWRGIWTAEGKSKKSERSKLVSPGAGMAVEMTSAEIVEALFGRDAFFDLTDDATPEERQQAEQARTELVKDFYNDGIIDTMGRAAQYSSLYGTGIIKIAVDVERKATPKRIPKFDEQGNQDGTELVRVEDEVVSVYPVAVEPGQFVPDPSTPFIDQMLGCAHEFRMPLHKIAERQRMGTYYKTSVGPYNGPMESATQNRNVESDQQAQQWAEITEWHGLVPKRMLLLARNENDPVAESLVSGMEDEMIEAIITIANGGTLLRAIPNPAVMNDRAFVAWQHETVPDRFWGRGVMEKAYHPQKALDAEMRARVDNLAWVSNPMLKADLTKLPPRTNFNAYPGKVWATRGDPDQAIREMRFGDINGSSFQQTAELQAMLQQATGTVDSLASIRGNIRDETATGSAIAASGFLKRAKRTMYNIEGALTEMVRRTLWRKMQFDPERFPNDHEFVVKGTTGMMARELESQQMINLLQFVQQGTPPYLLLIKSIIASSSSPVKAEMEQAIEQMMQPQPPDPAAEQLKQLQLENAQLSNKKIEAEISKMGADAGLSESKAQLAAIQASLTDHKVGIDQARLNLDQQEIDNQKAQLALSAEKNDISKAQLAIDHHHRSRGV